MVTKCETLTTIPSCSKIPEITIARPEIEPTINNLQYVVESIVIEDKGKLIALIYPDFDAAKADGLEGENLYNALKASVMQANKSLPSYARVADVRIQQQEFEKTPKHSIKRFLYQK